ncbi:MAG TPA: BMP family ABC transporter substrate-binding protein [Clostridiales bacterium]|nr:BMP family ABC transporter substrate-binding protein [Clostridiales bacterium]
MKRKIVAMISCLALLTAAFTGCSNGSKGTAQTAANSTASEESAGSKEETKASGNIKIALITMDQIDQHWVKMNHGAQEEAKKKNVKVDFISPDTKDDSKQIECVNNAVANGYKAIMVAANGPDAISSALKDAKSAGVKIVYVDSPANVEAEATFSTNNAAAGKKAGEEMLKALKAKGTTKGNIGVVNVNAATQSCVDREKGFRSAFEGSEFKILDTQYCDGDASKAQSIAENYITQGVVGIFGAQEGSTTGTGNAVKASKNSGVIGVGFDSSDSIKDLINDGYLLCTMAQKPEIMGAKGGDACVDAINGKDLGGKVTDTGVTVLNKDNVDSAK